MYRRGTVVFFHSNYKEENFFEKLQRVIFNDVERMSNEWLRIVLKLPVREYELRYMFGEILRTLGKLMDGNRISKNFIFGGRCADSNQPISQ